MKNTDDFHYKRKPSCAIAKSILFAVSKDEWDTKEDTGKSMKNALYIDCCGIPKDTSRAEATLNSEKCSLSRYQVKASVSQLLSQSVENSIK